VATEWSPKSDLLIFCFRLWVVEVVVSWGSGVSKKEINGKTDR